MPSMEKKKPSLDVGVILIICLVPFNDYFFKINIYYFEIRKTNPPLEKGKFCRGNE